MPVIARGLFLQDMPIGVVRGQAWQMALMAIAMLTVAGFAARRTVG